jgi:hypothetical protein
VVVVGAAVVGLLDPSMYAGDAGWVRSGICCSVRSGAIVVGGSMAVGVSVTWSRTLLTAADAMNTAVRVTASQMSR